ncbi:hypothetical protein [Streptococcus pluranimalium]
MPHLLGFSDYQETILEAPYNVDQSIWIDSQGVPPAFSGEDYNRELANKIYRLGQLNFPTLVLCTSKDALEQL